MPIRFPKKINSGPDLNGSGPDRRWPAQSSSARGSRIPNGLTGGAQPSARQKTEGVRDALDRSIKSRSTARCRHLPQDTRDGDLTLGLLGRRGSSPRGLLRPGRRSAQRRARRGAAAVDWSPGRRSACRRWRNSIGCSRGSSYGVPGPKQGQG
jgi:hypothetical protein